jgi:truncated hemoglobin YjbI
MPGAGGTLDGVSDTTVPGERPALSCYDTVGGEATFRLLVDRFYDTVETDPVLEYFSSAAQAPRNRP